MVPLAVGAQVKVSAQTGAIAQKDGDDIAITSLVMTGDALDRRVHPYLTAAVEAPRTRAPYPAPVPARRCTAQDAQDHGQDRNLTLLGHYHHLAFLRSTRMRFSLPQEQLHISPFHKCRTPSVARNNYHLPTLHRYPVLVVCSFPHLPQGLQAIMEPGRRRHHLFLLNIRARRHHSHHLHPHCL